MCHELKDLLISKIVPSERILSRESLERSKRGAGSSDAQAPRVVSVGALYYVRDGNHRIMAAKECGQLNVLCKIEQKKTKVNVADFEEDDCREAIDLGMAGFNNIEIVDTDEEKERRCREDDEEEF